MTRSDSSAAATSASGGRPVPASMMTRRGSARRWAPSSNHRRSPSVVSRRPAGTTASNSVARCSRRARRSGPASERSQSWTPGPSGSGSPSTVIASPARSTSRVGESPASALATAYTVVPLPPLAAQQIVSMSSSTFRRWRGSRNSSRYRPVSVLIVSTNVKFSSRFPQGGSGSRAGCRCQVPDPHFSRRSPEAAPP